MNTNDLKSATLDYDMGGVILDMALANAAAGAGQGRELEDLKDTCIDVIATGVYSDHNPEIAAATFIEARLIAAAGPAGLTPALLHLRGDQLTDRTAVFFTPLNPDSNTFSPTVHHPQADRLPTVLSGETAPGKYFSHEHAPVGPHNTPGGLLTLGMTFFMNLTRTTADDAFSVRVAITYLNPKFDAIQQLAREIETMDSVEAPEQARAPLTHLLYRAYGLIKAEQLAQRMTAPVSDNDRELQAHPGIDLKCQSAIALSTFAFDAVDSSTNKIIGALDPDSCLTSENFTAAGMDDWPQWAIETIAAGDLVGLAQPEGANS